MSLTPAFRRTACALSALLLLACHRQQRAQQSPLPAAGAQAAPVVLSSTSTPKSIGFHELTWQLSGPFGPEPVIVIVPEAASAEHRFPVLIAFHGRGESLKAPERGARGFIDDYGLMRALERVQHPPLLPTDFGGLISEERLSVLNAGLRTASYRGMIIVCPYLPDSLHTDRWAQEGRLYTDFIVKQLLPKIYAETPALAGSETTAVDGVSLGGRAALSLMVFAPRSFGVVGATQPAIDNSEIPLWVNKIAEARKQNPTLTLRLLTSDADYFLQPTRALSQALTAAAISHRIDEVTGDHSYEFNRGPGVYEMLLFHDRALREKRAITSQGN
ncbi:MAG TPA: alpha/beta hydrolase-fold protein [Polyangiaceae bacterium]|nr:alpha/beta hydrolase-fold protein [Polyangiaceae bacterium]